MFLILHLGWTFFTVWTSCSALWDCFICVAFASVASTCCTSVHYFDIIWRDVREVKGRSDRVLWWEACAVSRISDQVFRGESRTCLQSTFSSTRPPNANEFTASLSLWINFPERFIPSDPRSEAAGVVTHVRFLTVIYLETDIHSWECGLWTPFIYARFINDFWVNWNIQWGKQWGRTGFMHHDLIG